MLANECSSNKKINWRLSRPNSQVPRKYHQGQADFIIARTKASKLPRIHSDKLAMKVRGRMA